MRTIAVFFAVTLSGCNSIEEKIEKHQLNLIRGNAQSSDVIVVEKVEPKSFDAIMDMQIVDKAQRNNEQSKLLAKSEVNCSAFIEKTHFSRAMTTFGLGLYSNIASTAAAIVSGRAGQNLAGVSSVFGFMSDSLNQEMYSGILMPALTREISDRRTAMFKEITDRQSKELDVYPYPLAIMDAIRYHNLCSIPFALVGLINKTNAVQQLDYSAQINNLDGEINKQAALLKDNSLGLSSAEKNTLRQQIMDLTKRRELMTLSLPHSQIDQAAKPYTETLGSQPKPVEKPIDAPIIVEPQ